jgi:hypothetical protein
MIRPPARADRAWVDWGHLEPLASPDPLDDKPTRLPQQPGGLAKAVAAILPGQCDDVGGPLFVFAGAMREIGSSIASAWRKAMTVVSLEMAYRSFREVLAG